MKMSDGVEWALHCVSLLSVLPDGMVLPGKALAEFHGVSESYLLKHLKALAKAGILASTPGPKGGYRLTRRSDAITLLDVVLAIEGRGPAFRCKDIRRCGPAASPKRAYRTPCAIHLAMADAENAWRERLAATRLSDVFRDLPQTIPAETRRKAILWLRDNVRGDGSHAGPR
jgi:Rrf2 family protein